MCHCQKSYVVWVYENLRSVKHILPLCTDRAFWNEKVIFKLLQEKQKRIKVHGGKKLMSLRTERSISSLGHAKPLPPCCCGYGSDSKGLIFGNHWNAFKMVSRGGSAWSRGGMNFSMEKPFFLNWWILHISAEDHKYSFLNPVVMWGFFGWFTNLRISRGLEMNMRRIPKCWKQQEKNS